MAQHRRASNATLSNWLFYGQYCRPLAALQVDLGASTWGASVLGPGHSSSARPGPGEVTERRLGAFVQAAIVLALQHSHFSVEVGNGTVGLAPSHVKTLRRLWEGANEEHAAAAAVAFQRTGVFELLRREGSVRLQWRTS